MLGKSFTQLLAAVVFFAYFASVITFLAAPSLVSGGVAITLWILAILALALDSNTHNITLAEAREWCRDAHGEQMYGEHPYEYHLNAVEAVAVRSGFDDVITRMGCQGHDVFEDTKKKPRDMLRAGFPMEVVDICHRVTDEPGATRHEKKAKTLPKIAASRRAIIVKLCDRIANTEESKKNRPDKFATYKSEFAEFQKALRNRNDKAVEPMWRHLESLYGLAA